MAERQEVSRAVGFIIPLRVASREEHGFGNEGTRVREDGGSYPPEAGRQGRGHRPHLRRGGPLPLRRGVHSTLLRAAGRQAVAWRGREGGDGGLFPLR